MKKCPFCDKDVGNSPHIYYCKEKTTDIKSDIKFLYISKNFPNISSIDTVKEYYLNKIKSLPDIKKEFGIDFKSFIFLLDYYNIERRSIKDSSKLISINKYKKTCIEKYGVDNISKLDSVKSSKKKTFMKNYGVDNIFKDLEFKKWIAENNFAWNNLTDEQNKERCLKQTESIKKYWNDLTDEQKSKLYNYGGTSKLETKISEVLNSLSISYTTQYHIKGKIFDFKITNTNILLEVNGDYWHCNPIKYNIDESIKFPGEIRKVKDVWEKDNNKRERVEKNGYKVIYIWESEMKESDDLTKLVLSKLNI